MATNENVSAQNARSHLRPKLAATLILTRRTPRNRLEILLGRRSRQHVFMPHKYVFPGGKVDRGDGFAPFVEELSPRVIDTCGKILSKRRTLAVVAAAIRETAEETGLLVARPGRTKKVDPAWQSFYDAGVLPNASAVDIVARAITPPGRPRRFDTWFFTASINAVHGSKQLISNGELEDLRWVAYDDIFSLNIPAITLIVLKELTPYHRPNNKHIPSISVQKKRLVVKML